MGDMDGLGYRGETAVVTGGASGMGEAVARILGELGANVHIVDIAQPSVPHASFHKCDLSNFAEVRRTAEALKAIAPIKAEQAWPLILLNSPLNAVITGSFLYTDQGFASGVLTGAIDLSAVPLGGGD